MVDNYVKNGDMTLIDEAVYLVPGEVEPYNHLTSFYKIGSRLKSAL
jgi:hypothetical protein